MSETTPPPYNQEDESATEASSPKERRWRGGDFLNLWLNRRANQGEITERPEEDEEDNEEEGSGPTKKWRRAFRRLFSGLATPEYATEGATESNPDLPETGFEEASSQAEEPEGLLRISHEDEYPLPDLTFDELPLAETQTLPTSEEASDYDETETEEEETTQAPAEAEESFLETRDLSAAVPEYQPLPLPKVEVTPPTPEPAIVERGPAAAAFVAAEVLSRRRDRKIKRQARKLEKQLSSLEKENKRALSQLERLMAPKAESVDVKTKEKPPTVLERLVSTIKPERSIAKPERQAPSLEQAKAIETRPDKPQRMVKLEELLHAHPEKMRPETVQHEVEKAAEQDMPIEKVYEMRHEIKDEVSPIKPLRVGSSSAPLQFPPPVQAAVAQASRAAEKTVRNYQPLPAETGLYRQAVHSGVLAAFGVLLLLAAYRFIT